MAWPEADLERLKILAASGEATAREIGEALGRTRNAVIGMMSRMGLSKGQAKRGRRPSAPPKARPAPAPQPARVAARPAPRPRPETLDEPAALGAAETVGDAFTCRWIHGDPREPGWRMCGHPVDRDGETASPWCPHHHARVYQRRDDPARGR